MDSITLRFNQLDTKLTDLVFSAPSITLPDVQQWKSAGKETSRNPGQNQWFSGSQQKQWVSTGASCHPHDSSSWGATAGLGQVVGPFTGFGHGISQTSIVLFPKDTTYTE